MAITVLRILLALIARFNLETLQLDAVNVFVHAFLDEVVFMRMPFGYEEQGKVLRLNKALYGLRRSPLLWQRKFTDVLRRLGFIEIPQEPCIVVCRGIIIFFFVDDCVIVFPENKRNEVMAATDGLVKEFTIDIIGELKWFLGMHIIRNCSTGCLWLFQKAYIEKICKNLMGPPSSRPPATPMDTAELLSAEDDGEISNDFRTLYQRKIGSLLFAAISTRPDIVFAVSRLSRFNVRPGRKHHAAAERVLQYFYHTRNKCIRYGGNKIIDKERCLISFVCASDASFADNTIDRKSSQGYIMKLFNGPVAWRANKQDTVTTSSTEAEFLAIFQTAKEVIYLSRLMRSLILHLPEPLSIECDNMQTIRLLVAESLKLQTKLRHVDIHSHWLRQEVQRGSIHMNWVPIKRMIADGLIKALTSANFEAFVKMIGLEDKTSLFFSIQREDTLKHALIEKGNTEYSEAFGFGSAIN